MECNIYTYLISVEGFQIKMHTYAQGMKCVA